ncbi:thiol S-methyltransferase TMT1A-like [Prorops nasuta]|uniref:thiol S-methyltransferase TMT1A-like n=1 Tax=Prorops nasuta TaxID=863751 RepID=UPI0034CD3CFA
MSTSDLWMRDLFLTYGLTLLCLLIGFYLFARKWQKLRKHCYRSHLIGFETECAELALPYKEKLFKHLQTYESSDLTLRSLKCIRLLEIGVKTGENIQFYPEGTRLLVVDWNLKLKEYLQSESRAWQFSHVQIEHVIHGDGSSLKDVPTGFVDVVVSTRSLCSVKSINATLREIRRILAPGGQYIFMEHVVDKESMFVRWLQQFLSYTNIWPSLYGDCRLDLDIAKEIEKVGFTKVQLTPITLMGQASNSLHLFLSKYHIIGTANR